MLSDVSAQYRLESVPKVSVGMPAYNSADWIEESVGGLLAQTFTDFELIISDNASTDDTYAICERLAGRDPRIRLLHNERNIGANRNYHAVLDAARGEYFKWASSNDVCAPTFLEKCVAALDADPSAVLVCPRTAVFDQSVAQAQSYDRDVELLSAEPAERFIGVLNKTGLNNAVNGLIRRTALQRTSRMGTYMGADVVLMTELALMGRFLIVDEQLFFRRMSSEAATKLKSAREVDEHLDPTARGPLKWQLWRYHLALLRAASRAPFLSRDWLRTVNYGLRALVWSRKALAGDAWRAIRQHAW
jgi:glycosyltransferase involved in cell wall biosynthesis